MAKYMVAEKVTEIVNIARMANFVKKKNLSLFVLKMHVHLVKSFS